MSAEATTRNIVIIGGGIIGCTTAYYLSRHPQFASSSTKITLIEASKHGIAQGASGKAGGLVAQWAYPKELVKVSFPEHVRLAEEHNGAERWGWRFVACGSWEGRGEDIDEGTGTGVGAGGERKSLEKTFGLDAPTHLAETGLPADLNWIKDELTSAYSPMAPAGATAQVHPYLFSRSMLDLARERGVELVSGKVTAIDIDKTADRRVSGVTYTPCEGGESRKIPATHVVLAAGVWSRQVLPAVPVVGTRAHSITIRPPPSAAPLAAHVLFTEIALPGAHASPEIYARPSNEAYCCGPGDDSPVPDTVDDVEVDEAACESIRAHVASISPVLRAGTVQRRQACFLPVVSTGGGPIVGEAPSIAAGLLIATGHTCWGISNAPGTAKAIAELIMDGKISCADLQKLRPARFL